MRGVSPSVVGAMAITVLATSVTAQIAPTSASQVPSSAPAATPPPATQLEGFKPSAGSVVTLAYDQLGKVGPSISVNVRQVHDSNGLGARGLQIEVNESQYRSDRSFVDEDEIAELIKGLDALVAIKFNPTRFEHFEVAYITRGELRVTAYDNAENGSIKYAVRVGRTLKAEIVGLSIQDMAQLRALFEAASQILTARSGAPKL